MAMPCRNPLLRANSSYDGLGNVWRAWGRLMEDLGQALAAKVEQITEEWILAVHQDAEIESARKLAYEAVRNSLPDVLAELSSLLSQYQQGDHEALAKKSLYHGFVRAQQGYDAAEMVREYRLLRQILLKVLEPELLTGTALEVLRSLQAIDDVLDEITATSVERYIEARLRELTQMQSQLTLTNQELSRLVQVQNENLSFMAHELKSPLNSIIGHSTLLLRQQSSQIRSNDTVPNLEKIERVLRNSRRLLQLINDTLEIARYHDGQIQLKLVPMSVGDSITEVVEDGFEAIALEKGLEIALDVSEAPVSTMCDELRLQQLITNLVSNAIRYTDAGSVRVVCRQIDSESWQVAVTDTGVGIAEENYTRIFDPYAQMPNQGQSLISTGLGLAIVKRIVDLMEGQISVESEVNRGTVFTVTLPMVLPEASS